MKIEKPAHYKSHFIVQDGGETILIINIDNSHFQVSKVLGKDYQEFTVTDMGDHLEVIEQ